MCSVLEGHSDNVRAVAFRPDGKLLAPASFDNTVRLWDPTTGARCSTLKSHSDYVNAVAFRPDGQLLAFASNDKTVRLWDPITGALRSILEGHSRCVNAVAFRPDGQLLPLRHMTEPLGCGTQTRVFCAAFLRATQVRSGG